MFAESFYIIVLGGDEDEIRAVLSRGKEYAFGPENTVSQKLKDSGV